MGAFRKNIAGFRSAVLSFIVLICCLGFILIQAGCYYPKTSPGWEYMPDMSHSVAYETYSANPNFHDSTSAQRPVEGTIPHGVFMPFHFANTPAGYDSASLFVHFPDWLTSGDTSNLEEGHRLFGIYCAVCHGTNGTGNGTIVVNPKLKNPFPPPPSYFDANHIGLTEGKMYFSVHYGKNLMGPYSKSLDQAQIWKIVSYVKSMQQHYIDSVRATGKKVAGIDSALTTTATAQM